jgi:hypothetical protein
MNDAVHFLCWSTSHLSPSNISASASFRLSRIDLSNGVTHRAFLFPSRIGVVNIRAYPANNPTFTGFAHP